MSRIQIGPPSFVLQRRLSERGRINYQITRPESLEDFDYGNMAKTNVLNVLEQDAPRRLGLVMDSAGLAFVPKSVLVTRTRRTS